MREIKFRYLLKNNVEMYFKWYTLKQIESEGLKSLFDVESYEILSRDRFTGHQDKNGVDIYEGDRVSHAKESNVTSKCTMIGNDVVCWDKRKARFQLGADDVWGMIYKAYEITGNIHDK